MTSHGRMADRAAHVCATIVLVHGARIKWGLGMLPGGPDGRRRPEQKTGGRLGGEPAARSLHRAAAKEALGAYMHLLRNYFPF